VLVHSFLGEDEWKTDHVCTNSTVLYPQFDGPFGALQTASAAGDAALGVEVDGFTPGLVALPAADGANLDALPDPGAFFGVKINFQLLEGAGKLKMFKHQVFEIGVLNLIAHG
jgi:hypothetical protein